MALKLVVMKNSGATVEYWKISQTIIDHTNYKVHIHLAGYVNKAMRDAGKEPELVYQIDVEHDKMTFKVDLRDDGYKAIKNLEAWKDAEDLLTNNVEV